MHLAFAFTHVGSNKSPCNSGHKSSMSQAVKSSHSTCILSHFLLGRLQEILQEHDRNEMWSPGVDPDPNANDMAKLSGFFEQYGSPLGPRPLCWQSVDLSECTWTRFKFNPLVFLCLYFRETIESSSLMFPPASVWIPKRIGGQTFENMEERLSGQKAGTSANCMLPTRNVS